MANKKFWLGILVMALVFGMTVVGCEEEKDDDKGGGTLTDGGGPFTLNNIPAEHNGKYAWFQVGIWDDDDNGFNIEGLQSINLSTYTFTCSPIANGSVSIPLWKTGNGAAVKYSGNDTVELTVRISSSQAPSLDTIIGTISFQSVTFSNGKATKAWSDGTFTAKP
jgi:hypothetical protein